MRVACLFRNSVQGHTGHPLETQTCVLSCGPYVLMYVDLDADWRDRCSAVWTMSHARQTLGKIGEDFACRELEQRGYAILARRYRRRGGELDIIARDGRDVVFVEVKARDGLEFGEAAEAVSALKRHRMVRLALDYLARHHLTDCPCRFDVVSIQIGPGEPAIEVYQNAFSATD
jgi:putative endonuclease